MQASYFASLLEMQAAQLTASLRAVVRVVVAPTVAKREIALVALFQDVVRPVAPTVAKILASLPTASFQGVMKAVAALTVEKAWDLPSVGPALGSHQAASFQDVVRPVVPTGVRTLVSPLVEPALGSHQVAAFRDVARLAVLAVVKT
jgi:hypothetical protein